MSEQYTKARFWKCALQVNPYNYNSAYRGTDHGMTEERYNQELLRVAKEQGIKVIGLADHGNVDGVDAIRTLMNEHSIIVFPGFEITSSEKAHFVCLFSEETTTEELHRYLGNLELLDPEDGIRPSKLSAESLLEKVGKNLDGFVYAAHCTTNKGVLHQKLHHVWQNPLLKAAQIPGTLDDSEEKDFNTYRQILLNQTPEYKRERPLALINAKDVAEPNDLADPKAFCLIKMTKLCFKSFKLAFQDSVSRVRLNSDLAEQYYSRIEALKMTGGYLDKVDIEFSGHLNAVIGGRGTGKSTLLECIRYALALKPIGKNAQKQHDEIIKENLGKSKARIELTVRSAQMHGKQFTIARRYGENASVKDATGDSSAFTPSELLPEVEVYGQNEIYEIAQDKESQRRLLNRSLDVGQRNGEAHIHECVFKLSENRKKLIDVDKEIATLEDKVARLPKLEERIGQFQTHGLEEKLQIVPLLEKEKLLCQRATEEEAKNLDEAFQTVRDKLPDTVFLSEHAIAKLPHGEVLRNIRKTLDSLRHDAQVLLKQWEEKYAAAQDSLKQFADELGTGLSQEESKLEEIFKNLPGFEGKTGKEIGIAFQHLLKEIEGIRPQKALIGKQKNLQKELARQRQTILNELSTLTAERSAEFERTLKQLNKQLDGKLRLSVKPEANREPVIQFLLGCNLESIAEKRLVWIHEVDDFSPVRLAELIQQGVEALQNSGWNITSSVASGLSRLTKAKTLQLQELELPDVINIELNTSHQGRENFRPLEKLSTGQQCTAILHLLLLKNTDPLLIDQPEDNLDNAFIADRIVTELRSAKTNRQFIVATHNANIPVFGDAEWIGVLEVQGGQARIPLELQGAIDVEPIRNHAADILEGGKSAFNQRKDKYGF